MPQKTPDPTLWRLGAHDPAPAVPLREDIAADLVIVGGGFTGCSAALEAARRGASVVLLEAAEIGHGGSGRNVGLVNSGLWLPPDAIEAAMGPQDGQRLIAALGSAPAHVFDLIGREGIACDAVRGGTLHLAHSAAGLADLRDRLRQGNRQGAPLRLLDADETARRLGSARFHGALFNPQAGTVQPLAYCHGLARAAAAQGARLHDRSPVTGLSQRDGLWRLDANGACVRAPRLLVATNAYHAAVSGLDQPQTAIVHYSQFATDPLPHALRARILPGGEGCWDTAPVMTSIRTDAAGRLILGGVGNAEGPGGALHAGWARRKLARLFPDLRGIGFSHVWQGRIAMAADHIPKAVRIGPGGLTIFGYSGRGIGPGTVVGTAAARALLEDRTDALPLPVQERYREALTGARTLSYELGASLAHALAARPGLGRL